MNRFSFLVASAALLGCAVASASEAQPDTLSLPNVEVSAPAMKAPVELLPLTVSIVSRQEIEESAETSLLPILTNHVPGMFVTERGIAAYGISGGAAGTTSIRGVGGGGGVLFMIDGQPQWAGIFGHALPDTYTAEDVERVEVVRGPSSLLYGSNAMGGSVNIITRHGEREGFAGRVRMMWGSYGTRKYAANASYRRGRFNAFASASYEMTDGHRRNMQSWLANEFLSLQYRFSSHWKAGLNTTLTQATPHNPGTVIQPLEHMWTRFQRYTFSASVSNSYDRTQGSLQLYANTGRHTINDGTPPERDYLFRSNDFNMGLTAFQNIRPWQDNTLSLGFDLQHWGGHSWNRMLDGSPNQEGVDERVTELGGYAMMQQGLIANRLMINAGLRLQHNSQFGNVLVPQAGIVSHPFTGSTMKFSWGRGFRSPNLRELYLYPPHNPDLKPESLWNYELSLRQAFFSDRRLEAGVTLYWIDGENMIQTRPGENPHTGAQMMNVNTGTFTNKGFEIDLTYAITKDLRFTANYSYLHASENVLYAPKHKLFGELTYTPGCWEVSLQSLTVLRMGIGDDRTTNYSLLNGRLAYDIPLKGSISVKPFVSVDNITATRYETIAGFPMPRATALAGVSLGW